MVDVYYKIDDIGIVGDLVAGETVENDNDFPHHARIASMDLLNRPIITYQQMLKWEKEFGEEKT